MNAIGIYYAYWVRNWDADFHPFIDKVADLGFDLLEVNAGTVARMSAEERQALKQHAEDRGLLLSYCIGLPREYDIAAEDAQLRQAGVEFLKRMAEAIGAMGGGPLGGILYGCWPANLPPGVIDRTPFIDRSLDSMRKAIPAAEGNNVTFCLEVVNRFEHYIMNTAAEGIRYLEALESPHAKLLLDTFHMNIEESSMAKAVRTAGRHLGHLHIGENNRLAPGRGPIPWPELASALREIDYGGYVVMEPFVTPGGEVGRDIRIHRDLGAGMNLDQEAGRALAFVREVLRQAGTGEMTRGDERQI